MEASYQGHLDVVDLLLRQGVDINALDNLHQTALCNSCFGRDLEVAKLLVEAGADLELGDPLVVARDSGNPDLIRYLEKAREKSKEDTRDVEEGPSLRCRI